MVRKSLPILLLALLPLISGCDLLNNVNVKVDAAFDIDVPVSISGPEMKTGPFAFNGTQSFDLSTNQTVIDNADKIKDVTLTDLTGTITLLSAPINLTGTSITVTGNGTSASWTLSDMAIQTGTNVPLPDDNGQYAALSSMLAALSEVTATISGNSSANNVTYTLALKLNSQLTVGL